MIYAAGIRRLVISTRAKLLGIKLLIDQSICNQNVTLGAMESIKSMLSVYLDQSIQVELEILIVLLVDNSARRPHESDDTERHIDLDPHFPSIGVETKNTSL
jgi:hypothetical protein